ncbi:MAG: GNAT family N-acetyltransferase [Anaerolineales bacterium]|nr:GNAT family N-acetyltransferase [Anaerolineales bacterium]
MNIAPFASHHVSEAAELVAARFRALRTQQPILPEHFANPALIEPKISHLASTSPGVVALEAGKLCGFLLGMPLAEFKGRRAVYCPEWSHGAILEDSSRIYQAMYRELAPAWISDGRFLHVLTIFANDRSGLDAWFWQGFGMLVIDAVRELNPVPCQPRHDVVIRRMRREDIEDVQRHDEALRRHLAAAPIYLSYVHQEGATQFEEWLPGTELVMFVAEREGKIVASLGVGPANKDARPTIEDPGTGSILTAYTAPEVRNLGIGATLLAAAVAHLLNIGKTRCAVDFESQNIPAVRFWLQHFTPVCYSVMRTVDDRIAWAGAERPTGTFWRSAA